ncbi:MULTISPECIES: tRNA dihydrouridine synthase DusB [Cocleimonas]|jgi:tRNA-dihydrouridine synthase B|uniref:tRNA-dihydrouridine synthase n=1 Tax=Cocleimonas flava TaxID=634765 RepID=A0A4R1EUG9_9GAMM|nr:MULTISPECIES: tRNA dihydrouridine synthase DusB [Cocleimonas]MEB8433775.1 tRNA dihydrouridine synthase DusB [Cocleimonas sp. KMM 6892]MEC4716586.1 tRNA dihydrouridine synthase DusB [Cocleimonas sp. KMM 6895]MEC4746259.1 tRNA dihydrouridine synthase DusB [Cocleimonas sp. KMM 6896]TCJ84903.1 tRNA-U20-dihydrouridine synthase [Cocleimonas flava]
MSYQIGSYTLKSKLLLAPMAGITDRPYRDVCRQYGAGLTSSEMITSDLSLLKTRKTQQRLPQRNEPSPRSAQIVGTEPHVMAEAAKFNVDLGAEIIDINMGCPAKKVCNKAAGSALMKDTKLVAEILEKIVAAVDVPVTLKIRTGWESTHRNALEVARIAENAGIASLAIHGRTRNQGYTGHAEYETIRQIKHAIDIPVLANGDIKTIEDALFILNYTNVDGLMLGRISHGQPWIFKEINDILVDAAPTFPIKLEEKIDTTLKHIDAIHRYYGTDQGVRIARKHIGWYLSSLVGQQQKLLKPLTKEIYPISCSKKQLQKLESILLAL